MPALFFARGAQFLAGILGRDGMLQFPFDGEIEPFLVRDSSL